MRLGIRMKPFPTVVFEIDARRYGIALAVTREILRAASIVPLPKAPAIIEGVINVRGVVVPVLDIRKRFRLSPKPLDPSDQFVVARANERTVALRVDRVIGLSEIAAEDIEEAAMISPAAEYVAGIATLPDGLVMLHDLATFLHKAETRDTDAACAGIVA
jgi:purine-binding chemotaxis protein CheW